MSFKLDQALTYRYFTRKKFLHELKAYKAKITKNSSSNGPDRIAEQTAEIGDMFFEFVRTIIGHYSDHVTFDTGESDIDLTEFSDSAGIHSEFAWHVSRTQMFSGFVQGLTEETRNPFLDPPDAGV